MFKWYVIVAPWRSAVIRSASFKILKCPDSVGLEMSNASAISPALIGRDRNKDRILRRTGWARASKAFLIFCHLAKYRNKRKLNPGGAVLCPRRNFRFGSEPAIGLTGDECPLCAKSGHSPTPSRPAWACGFLSENLRVARQYRSLARASRDALFPKADGGD